VAELESRGYLDDARFARGWVEARAASGRLGPARLRAELRARGVAPEVAEAALREARVDEDAAARALAAARQRLPALLKRDRRRAPARLHDHLVRRGYPAGVARRVVRTLFGLEDDPGAP
jgi:regulatory protein